MHIFITAYVLLALASWSALAAPLSAQKDSSPSSILMGRQEMSLFDAGPGPEVFPVKHSNDTTGPSQDSTMDCDSKSNHKHDDDTNDVSSPATIANESTENTIPVPATTTSTGPAPSIARRRFRSPMRRGSNGSPSIFERDDAHTAGAPGKPITVGDIITAYLKQKPAARKRAPSPRTTRNFN